MTDLDENRFWLRTKSRDLLTRYAKWRRAIQIGFVIGGAFLAGGASLCANILPNAKPAAYIFQAFGLLMVFVGGVLMAFIDEGAPDAIQRAHEAIDEASSRGELIASLERDFQWLTQLYSMAAAQRDMIENIIGFGPGDTSAQAHRLAAMLDILVAEQVVLFGMGSDRWNYAIYLFHPDPGKLVCAACRRPIRAEEEAPHRIWAPGEGHVGIAFQSGREIVSADTAEPEARALFDAPDLHRRDDDRERYRSIASLPIRIQGRPPIGVLVATSDVPGRFHFKERAAETAQDPVEPLRVLAHALALAIETTHLMESDRGSNHVRNENA